MNKYLTNTQKMYAEIYKNAPSRSSLRPGLRLKLICGRSERLKDVFPGCLDPELRKKLVKHLKNLFDDFYNTA